MKNKLTDLNDHLFAQLERLSEEGLDAEQIEREVTRAEAVVKVADQITEAAKLRIAAARLYGEYGPAVLPLLPEIGRAPALKAVEGGKE